MKKTLKIVLPILIAAALFGATSTHAYGVSVGNIFTYDVVASNWDVTVGPDSSSGTGWNFLDVLRTVGSQFDVEVTAVDASGVDWEIQLGIDMDVGSNSAFDGFGLLILLVLPLLFTEDIALTLDTGEADLGLGLTELFFVDVETFSEVFYEMANTDIETDLSDEDPAINIDQAGGIFDNDTSIAVFEWHLDYTYVNASIDSNLSGTYVWQYAFDKSDGHMKGYYHMIDYSGTLAGVDFNYNLEQKVEEAGYDLPNVGAGILPGFEWFIVIPIVAILGGIAIIRRKRK
ncbi:MAG: choice-of-anchor S family protein [Candidatus Heimdallarchaeaceae archaeon]